MSSRLPRSQTSSSVSNNYTSTNVCVHASARGTRLTTQKPFESVTTAKGDARAGFARSAHAARQEFHTLESGVLGRIRRDTPSSRYFGFCPSLGPGRALHRNNFVQRMRQPSSRSVRSVTWVRVFSWESKFALLDVKKATNNNFFLRYDSTCFPSLASRLIMLLVLTCL